MQITYVLELLSPTRFKQNILESNIYQVYLNRTEISKQVKLDKTKLSTKNFHHKLPSAVTNQNIREVKALYKLFKKSKSHKDNISFKFNQPICFNNQNYKQFVSTNE